jgi:hypothetical protein
MYPKISVHVRGTGITGTRYKYKYRYEVQVQVRVRGTGTGTSTRYVRGTGTGLFLVFRFGRRARFLTRREKIAPKGRFFFGDDVAFKNSIFIKRLIRQKSEPSFHIWRIPYTSKPH